MGDSLKSFEQMRSWQAAIELAVDIYKLTSKFPISEQYGITNQLRRSVSSISANIAEGFGRKTVKDKLHFYTIDYGSLLEVKSFLLLSEKLGYLPEEDLENCNVKMLALQKMLNASKRALHE